jgi:RNA polymerase sigma-70 factor (ECF subfamily)
MSDQNTALASSLSTAFLLLLERLTPKERAAYLLHEIFELSYEEIASTLDIQESACRKLVSRARANIGKPNIRHVTPVNRQEELLAAFQSAVTTGRTDHLTALLSRDIELCADGGGRVPTVMNVLHGKTEVLEFLAQNLHTYWAEYQWLVSEINGARGIVLQKDGQVVGTVSFAYDDAGAATNIYIVRNPDKLGGLAGHAVS